MKRKTSGPSSWAETHPQPEAFLRLTSLPSPTEATSLRRERNPTGILWPDWPKLKRQHCLQFCRVCSKWEKICSQTTVHFTISHSFLLWTHIWLALYRGEAGNPCALSRCLPSSKFGLTAVAYIFQTNESRLKVQGSMPWSLLTQFPISALWGLPLCWWFPSLHLQPQLKQLSDFRLSPLLPFHQYFWRVQHHSSFCPVK